MVARKQLCSALKGVRTFRKILAEHRLLRSAGKGAVPSWKEGEREGKHGMLYFLNVNLNVPG